MVGSSITSETSTYRVVLAISGAPSIDIGYAEHLTVTGLTVIYEDGRVAEVTYLTECGSGAFLDREYLDKPDEWPSWLPAVIERHRPAV